MGKEKISEDGKGRGRGKVKRVKKERERQRLQELISAVPFQLLKVADFNLPHLRLRSCRGWG